MQLPDGDDVSGSHSPSREARELLLRDFRWLISYTDAICRRSNPPQKLLLLCLADDNADLLGLVSLICTSHIRSNNRETADCCLRKPKRVALLTDEQINVAEGVVVRWA